MRTTKVTWLTEKAEVVPSFRFLITYYHRDIYLSVEPYLSDFTKFLHRLRIYELVRKIISLLDDKTELHA